MTEEQFDEIRAAMPDKELVELCDKELSKLCKSYGESFTMRIPPKAYDTDMLFNELIRRYKEVKEL